ncbi:MAG: S26 family signal peptidase [Bdellovibrionales bacterium]|nr:S26 family signal peptidase [Bdellovibrionales bacterium]
MVIHGQARKLLLKRVAAVPGDSFEVRDGAPFQGAELLVNGKRWGIAESSPRKFTPTLAASLKRLVAYFRGKIPPNSILALGLSQDSYDSVSIGLISTEDILGVVR